MSGLTELSRTELELMKILWKRGRATVKDVWEVLYPEKRWSYTTVMTMLGRIYEKGYLRRKKVGMAYLYEPRVSERKTVRKIMSEFIERVFDGALGPLVNYIAESGKLKPGEVEELERLARSLIKREGKHD